MNARNLDLRDPWVVSVHRLLHGSGEQVALTESLPAPEGLGSPVLGVPEEAPVDLRIRLESVSEGILASGTVSAELVGQCSRCLAYITDRVVSDIQELYFHPGRGAGDEEDLLIVDDHIDLTRPVRDAIIVDLPFSPLCREDCLGLCPSCGADLNDDPGHDHGQAIDPRWAKLAEGIDLAGGDPDN